MLDVNDITNYIFVSGEPCKVDSIFVVGGSLPIAAELAAKLYKDGFSKNIIIGGKYSIKRDSFSLPEYETEYDFYKDILITNGVNEADIYGEDRSEYTKHNAGISHTAPELARKFKLAGKYFCPTRVRLPTAIPSIIAII